MFARRPSDTLASSEVVLRFGHSWCLRCLLLVMCTYPVAKEALMLHFARSEGHERYFGCNLMLSIIIINPGLDSRARTALEHMLESVVSARGKVLRTNFSATSRVTRATKLTQAASRHSYRWCSPPTRGSATTFAVGDGRCVTVLKLGVSLFSPKWQRSS